VTDVSAGKNESFESLLRRFNKKIQQSGVLSDLKQSESFEKPSSKRKRKEAAGKRRSNKTPGQEK
jgi:small subunit ribosomal protein S21